MYYAQNQFANEQIAILDSNYRPVADYNTATEVFLANFDQDIYILIN